MLGYALWADQTPLSLTSSYQVSELSTSCVEDLSRAVPRPPPRAVPEEASRTGVGGGAVIPSFLPYLTCSLSHPRVPGKCLCTLLRNPSCLSSYLASAQRRCRQRPATPQRPGARHRTGLHRAGDHQDSWPRAIAAVEAGTQGSLLGLWTSPNSLGKNLALQ